MTRQTRPEWGSRAHFGGSTKAKPASRLFPGLTEAHAVLWKADGWWATSIYHQAGRQILAAYDISYATTEWPCSKPLNDGRGHAEGVRKDQGRVCRGVATDDLLLRHAPHRRACPRPDREGIAIHASVHRLDCGRG